MDLGAVDGEHRDADQTGIRAQRQDLAEEAGQRVLMALTEPRDRRVVRDLVRGEDAKRDVFLAAALDRPRRPDSTRVPIEQQRHHLSSTGRRNAVWPVTLKLGSDELTFWVTAAVVVEARPEGGPERR